MRQNKCACNCNVTSCLLCVLHHVASGFDAFKGRPELIAWRDCVRKDVGEKLFDEAHRPIMTVNSLKQIKEGNEILEKLKIRFQKFFIWRSVGVQRDYTTMFDAKMAVICWFNVIYQLRDIKRFEKLCSFCPHCFINVFICKNSSLYLHKLKFTIFSSKNKRTKKIEACKGATIR